MRTQKQQAATLRQQNTAFLNGEKVNGTYGFNLIVGHLTFWNECGDWRPLAELLNNAVRGDADKFRAIVGECVVGWSWKGGKFVKPEGEANYGVDMGAVGEFAKLAAKNASFRAWSKVKAKDERTEAEKTQAALAKQVAASLKMCERADITVEQFAGLMRLLKLDEAA